jgi:hypothetical protein
LINEVRAERFGTAWPGLRIDPAVSFSDAERLIRAFHQELVDDSRRSGLGAPSRGPLPVGAGASTISAISLGGSGRGWQVHLGFLYGRTIYDVEVRNGRVVVTGEWSVIA